MNYAMLPTITQDPTASLEQLQEALREHTHLSPDSIKRGSSRSWPWDPEQSLESLLNLATSVFYNRDQEEQAERDRRDKRKAAALVMTFRQADPRAQKRERLGLAASLAELATTVAYQDTLRKVVPRGMNFLLILAHFAKGITERHTVPGDEGPQGLKWLSR
ncbi:hypothetical protein AAY473_024672 [Plecturocebus cupreus]